MGDRRPGTGIRLSIPRAHDVVDEALNGWAIEFILLPTAACVPERALDKL